MGSILGGGALDVTRIASITEDPANRRRNGPTGRNQYGIYLIPMTRPEILTAAGVPAIVTPHKTKRPACIPHCGRMALSGRRPRFPAFVVQIVPDPNSRHTLTAGGVADRKC